MMDFQAAKYLVDGVVPQQAGNDHPVSTPMGVVQAADEFINIAVGGQGQWKSFCAAIDQPNMADHPDYATQDRRLQNRARLSARLAEIFATKSSAEWLRRLEQASVPAGPIYKMDEVFADPQVQHLKIAVPVTDRARSVSLVGQPLAMSRTPAAIATLLPAAGHNNEELLIELGFSASEIAGFRKDRAI